MRATETFSILQNVYKLEKQKEKTHEIYDLCNLPTCKNNVFIFVHFDNKKDYLKAGFLPQKRR